MKKSIDSRIGKYLNEMGVGGAIAVGAGIGTIIGSITGLRAARKRAKTTAEKDRIQAQINQKKEELARKRNEAIEAVDKCLNEMPTD